ncbi:L-histidine N(alpha)-methyltransferase [Enterovirga sp.]|uniref:L-histidine N(alpha)-methyltransferase n=1 Tax=Enterovirga sp. TaxID=2026350 RepID=UPI00261EC18D|nr:L-histidine N(alpha)-methyltransferase [Enterovirga sp.]MDB5592702.1 hypothetical protein [Enterovirga sp.]
MNAPAYPAPRPAVPGPDRGTFLRDVVEGLGYPQKTIPAKYFYDLEGSRLFDEITRLPEYYPTRTELSILRRYGTEVMAEVPAGSAVVEFGAGSTEKIRVLLEALPDVAAYVPVDVSGDFLEAQADALRADRPGLRVVPVVGDFTREMTLPPEVAGLPLLGFFPGSTIGNFEPATARSLLTRFRDLLGPGALLVLGVDLVKDDAVLNAAYDDAAGVTARFNLNLLARINRELGADFLLERFRHKAFFNRSRSRIEMHLESLSAQTVRIGDHVVQFAPGETIHTENSYKYTPARFEALASEAGWTVRRVLTDDGRRFAMFVLRA